VKYMGAIWKPNGPGQGFDHLNNYVTIYPSGLCRVAEQVCILGQ
jgi:hypothetical protein